jgi:hypothetical protein
MRGSADVRRAPSGLLDDSDDADAAHFSNTSVRMNVSPRGQRALQLGQDGVGAVGRELHGRGARNLQARQRAAGAIDELGLPGHRCAERGDDVAVLAGADHLEGHEGATLLAHGAAVAVRRFVLPTSATVG